MDKTFKKLGQVCWFGDWQNFPFQWFIFWNEFNSLIQLTQFIHQANIVADGQLNLGAMELMGVMWKYNKQNPLAPWVGSDTGIWFQC